MAGPRPDLRRGCYHRKEEVGVPDGCRHRRGHEDVGNDSWRTGGGGGWMPGTYDSETNTILWGTAESGAALRLVGRRLQDARGAPRRQSLYEFSDRSRHRYRQAEILSSGIAARRLGLRQRRRRVRDAGARRPEGRGSSEQGRLRLCLRPQSRREERLAAG